MTNLSPAARLKAIELANALLEEGDEEGGEIRIVRAREWAAKRPR